MNLAIIKTNHLGDNVVFLPVVQELRRRFPDWRLTLLTAPRVAELYTADIAPENLLTVEPAALQRAWRRPHEFLRWWRELRRREFHASMIGYDQSSTAHALAWLAGGRTRVGGAGLRIRLRGTLTRGVAWQPGWSIAQWNWEIARALLADLGERAWPDAPPPPQLSHLAPGEIRQPRRVVIHAGSKWPYTRWALDRYTALAGHLARDHEVLWISAPEAAPSVLPPGVTAVASPDLSSLARLLKSAALFVGNNSGPMHVANSLGTPLVVITGPSDRAWDPAWHQERTTVLRTPRLGCQPCERVHFLPGQCTNTVEPMACLARWSVDAIEATCRSRLALSLANPELFP